MHILCSRHYEESAMYFSEAFKDLYLQEREPATPA